MKYQLHIAYANRPDLTEEAVASARAIGNFHLWPNNGAKPLENTVWKHTVLPVMSPISVINMMIQSSWDDDVMFWMHNDGFCKPGIAEAFLKHVEEVHASDQNWGVIFSLYDILCAFNMKAVREVGYWDPMFFQYTADPDYYFRMKHAGYEILNWEPGRDGVEHRGSMTVRSDGLFNYITQWRERKKFDKDYYAFKWGGQQGHERYKVPFEEYRPGETRMPGGPPPDRPTTGALPPNRPQSFLKNRGLRA